MLFLFLFLLSLSLSLFHRIIPLYISSWIQTSQALSQSLRLHTCSISLLPLVVHSLTLSLIHNYYEPILSFLLSFLLSTFLGVLAVPNKAVFCNTCTRTSSPITFNELLQVFSTSSVPTTIGVTVTLFTPHAGNFSLDLLVLLHLFFLLFLYTLYEHHQAQQCNVDDVAMSLFVVYYHDVRSASGACSYHFSVCGSLCYLARCQGIILATLSCLAL